MKKIMKWMHRGGALLLIAAMLFTQSGIVSLAEETGSVITITSAEDLVLLADSGKTENFSTGKTFVMTEDIDLSEYENMFIPIMDGTFDGGGHTITGICLQEEMSDYGFFRYVGPNGTVANLTVEATVTSGEDQADEGILANLEIAKIQRKKARRRFIKGGFCCLIGLGALILGYGIYMIIRSNN